MNDPQFRHIGTGEQDEEPPPPRQGRNLLAVIGIDDYAEWPRLRNAVSDALGSQRVFVERVGFTAIAEPLLNDAATKEAITRLVNDDLANRLTEDDALILFFAGHGHSRSRRVGGEEVETGFLIPVEARANADKFSNDYIKIDHFLEDVSLLPARHILIILDACNSGFALGTAMNSFRSAVRYEHDLVSRVSRKVITSARRDQLALDGGPVVGHSLFTGTLVDGFNWGKADLDSNGLVTASELGLYLQQKVAQHSESRQTPDFGSFNLDDRGELVISLRSNTFDALKARAFAALQNGDYQQFEALAGEVILSKPESPEALFLEYRLAFLQNKISQAHEALVALQAADWEEGALPAPRQHVEDNIIVLNYWNSVLSIPARDVPLRVECITRPAGEEGDGSSQLIEGEALLELEQDSVLQFRVTNLSDVAQHVYLVEIEVSGRVSFIRLWQERQILFEGIPPQGSAVSFPLRVFKQVGVHEWRLYCSTQPFDQMLAPPSLHTRGAAPPIQREEAATIRRRTPILYRVVQPPSGSPTPP